MHNANFEDQTLDFGLKCLLSTALVPYFKVQNINCYFKAKKPDLKVQNMNLKLFGFEGAVHVLYFKVWHQSCRHLSPKSKV